MKRVIFFIEQSWAYGVIHTELVSYLREYDIEASFLHWGKAYTLQEVQELADQVDWFVSSPYGLDVLQTNYQIQPEQCIAVCHSLEDAQFLDTRMTMAAEFLQRVGKIAGVSQWACDRMLEILNTDKQVYLSTVGINYNKFKAVPRNRLDSLGYAGAYRFEHNEYIKRTHLVEQVALQTGLPLKIAVHYHHTFVTMPGFYPTVGAVLISSTHEGAGLPLLEAAAGGCLVVSTPVGHWDRVGSKGAVEVSVDETKYVEQAVEIINFYKNNPREYVNRCEQIQEHAKGYDWKYHVGSWVSLLK
jgi:hypothetical protein